jgi:hypothetical protein
LLAAMDAPYLITLPALLMAIVEHDQYPTPPDVRYRSPPAPTATTAAAG